MDIVIDIEKFKKTYNLSTKLRHNTGTSILVLPYNTKCENKHVEFIREFKACVGEFCRTIYKSNLENSEITIDYIEDLMDSIETEERSELKSIIKNIFFDEDESLHMFHPLMLNYINANGEYNKALAKFLYDVLIECDDVADKISECFDYKPENIMERLILENMPELKKQDKTVQLKYKNFIPNVGAMFKIDIDFILRYPEIFLRDFENMLKYYYFFYVSQLALKFSKFFDYDPNDVEELYFNLDWETASKSRSSYSKGWKMIEENIKSMFSHVNTLEMLNSNDQEEVYDYCEMGEIIDGYGQCQENELKESIIQLLNLYKNNITDVVWEELHVNRKYENEAKNLVYELFKTVDYQFPKSTRKKPYEHYKKWFEEFCKMNFLKRRGSLGYTLNITQEYLLLITKLCIKDKERIKLKTLFKEYRKRGLNFDRESQNRIVELFEKLNLIEKKSDSGDAQYVRSIL